ncbi:homogentisate geranylgeranyltransferase [Citrus sinensis]|uniref:Homogentisate geranylgeranyltransferase n=1 Tax=Citrus sinensis TaxID=2711 RepID=A0ACB8N1K2_CITSI|nr:homogentisate geranylgeranyltransferase [Citrus sinensis]
MVIYSDVYVTRMIVCSRNERESCNKTLESPPVEGRRKSVKCSQSRFCLTSKIIKSEDTSNKSCKLMFNRPVTLQVCYASKSEDANQRTTSQEVFFKNLDALYRFIRPYGLMGTIIAITSVSLLLLQNLDDLTPTYFMGFLKAMVPGLLMTVYEFAINQLYDVKIDKSLAMGIILRSPPLLLALIIWFLLASAYSVDLPFLRWKRNSYLTTLYMVLERALVLQFAYFIHIQKYVLGRQIAIMRTLMFAVAIKCCFCFVISLLKDIPDEDGDREFGIQTPSVILGKESVLWLCVYVLLISYGAVIIVGLTSSPYLPSKLVMIISHIMLATLLWHQARTVDLSSKASTLSFYMFIWKLHFVQYLVLPFMMKKWFHLTNQIVMLRKRQMRNCLFNSDGDKKKVFVGGPLSFKNVIIALAEPKGEIALFLEKQIREIEKAQVRSYGGNTGHFLQLRVIIDVTKPLRKCVKLQSPNEENEVIILLLRYERLPDFCYNCGKIGHVHRECLEDKESNSLKSPCRFRFVESFKLSGDWASSEVS